MNENGPWTIGELSDLVLRVLHSSGLLEADYAGQPNGRVSSIPQERTIRWYASLGLLDKPLTMRGRTALYGRRHLCQLVAIKRLQAQGRSVAQVQEDLLGATDATLEGIAHLPKELLDASWEYEPTTGTSTFTLSRRPRFWAGGEDDDDSVGRGETFEAVARAARIVGDSADDDSVTSADDDTVTFEEEATATSRPARKAAGAGPSEAGAGSSGTGVGAAPAAARAGGAVTGAGLGAGGGKGARVARRAAATAAAEGAQGTVGARGAQSAQGTEGGRGAHGIHGARGIRAARDAEGAWGAHGPRGAEGAGVVPAVRLGSGVTLLLGAATRPVNAEDLERLEEAAGPLLALLRGRGLDGPDPGGTRDEHTS